MGFDLLLGLLLLGLIRASQSQETLSLDTSNQIVTAIVNGMSADKNLNSMLTNEKKEFKDKVISVSDITPEEANTISVIMNAMLPSMFGLFSNITSDDYKANFQEPCRFDTLMDLFKQLPPYFDVIAQKYPNKPDLIAYYSMQLASTFLVNNGSLTMACMYNMLSLQTRLNSFSLDIMDNPEKNPKLVGLFGVFMKPIMTLLKKNAMMKIIEHVDRYDKNDDKDTVILFQILNFLFVVLGMCGILSNVLLVILLKRSSIATRRSSSNKTAMVANNSNPSVLLTHSNTNSLKKKSNLATNKKFIGHNLDKSDQMVVNMNNDQLMIAGAAQKSKRQFKNNKLRNENSKVSKRDQKLISKYRAMKKTNSLMYYFIRKRYKTRICFIIIAICHSGYLLINFMIMSQASLAAVSLKGLSQFNMACKLAFFLFPPTTAYNILHQMAIWLLCYAIRQHGLKIRKTRTFNADADADHEVDLMNSDNEDDNDSEDSDLFVKYESSVPNEDDDDDDDTVSVSLTNNSNNLNLLSQSVTTTTVINQQNTVKFKATNNYHQILNHQRHPIVLPMESALPLSIMQPPNIYASAKRTACKPPKIDDTASESCLCYFFSHKRKNAMFCLILFTLLCIYDGQNLFLYSLAQLTSKDSTVYFCAFESTYAEYYTVLTQLIVPLSNLCLFSLLPMTLCTMQVLFDACFLVRVKREQMKRFEKLKEVIEWPLYAYYIVYVVSQVPFALHQIVDLCIGTTKFPFVFPLFIQLKFTSKVWLSVFEMTGIFLACASDLYIWIICDRQMRQLAVNWLNKRIFCRTYKQTTMIHKNNSKANEYKANGNNESNTNQNGNGKMSQKNSNKPSSSSNSRTSEVDSSSTSSSFSSCNRNEVMSKQVNIKFVKQQQQHQRHQPEGKEPRPNELTANPAVNNYASSTASSSVSSSLSSSKKQISPIIAAAADTAAATAKAAAAISASMAQPTIHDQLKRQQQRQFEEEQYRAKSPTSNLYSSPTSPTSPTGEQVNRIKMIDTDIDEIDDLDLDRNQLENEPMTKLYEEKEFEMMSLPRAYNEVPPSFNTALRAQHNSISSGYRHQYQNDIDLQALVRR